MKKIEQVSGGKDCQEKIGQKEEATLFKGAVFHYQSLPEKVCTLRKVR